MSVNPHLQHCTVLSGFAVSSSVSLGRGAIAGLYIPAMTSGQWTIDVGLSSDAASANWLPAMNSAADGIFAPAVETGSRYLSFHDIVLSAPCIRLNTGVLQADTRTITLVIKLP